MLEPADPRDDALDAHAEAAVRDAAEPAQIEVPLERLARELVLLDAAEQQVVVVDALAAADDLAVALGREDVDRERDLGPAVLRLEVEGLDRATGSRSRRPGRRMLGERRFVRAAEVAAPFEGQALLLEQLRRVVVRDARERPLSALELRRVALERP